MNSIMLTHKLFCSCAVVLLLDLLQKTTRVIPLTLIIIDLEDLYEPLALIISMDTAGELVSVNCPNYNLLVGRPDMSFIATMTSEIQV